MYYFDTLFFFFFKCPDYVVGLESMSSSPQELTKHLLEATLHLTDALLAKPLVTLTFNLCSSILAQPHTQDSSNIAVIHSLLDILSLLLIHPAVDTHQRAQVQGLVSPLQSRIAAPITSLAMPVTDSVAARASTLLDGAAAPEAVIEPTPPSPRRADNVFIAGSKLNQWRISDPLAAASVANGPAGTSAPAGGPPAAAQSAAPSSPPSGLLVFNYY